MKGADFGPRGEVRHDVELTEQLADHFTRIVAQAQLLELRHDALERVLRLPDRQLGVVLTLLLETSGMFGEFFAEERFETLAGWSHRGPAMTLHLDAR